MNSNAENAPLTFQDYHKGARQALGRGDLKAARDAWSKAVALNSTVISGRLMEAEILRAEGRSTEAMTVLETAGIEHPDNPWPAFYLASFARAAGDLRTARHHLSVALKLDPNGTRVTSLPMLEIGILREEGNVDVAIDRLETLRQRSDPTVQSLLLLATCYRTTAQVDKESQCLLQLAKEFPNDPQVLRTLFETRVKEASKEQVDAVLSHLNNTGQQSLAGELRAVMYARTAQYQLALDAMRNLRKRQRTEIEALRLMLSLWGTHRYALCLRYAQFCLRRWPNSPGVNSFYFRHRMRLGHLDEVAQLLDEHEDRLPEQLILQQRQMLSGYRADFETAAQCMERLRARKWDTSENRSTHIKLMYNLADVSQADKIFETIGHPKDWDARPLHRQGLPGMFAMEFDLELLAVQDTNSLEDWVRQRPRSPMAAIRLVDAWRHEEPFARTIPDLTPKIPKRIFQYWAQQDVPEQINAMIDSWRNLPNFQHQLFNRTAALKFLHETFGPSWVRAFQLATNPAMESDLLRLCLLAHYGGIYADADDFLHGDINKVIGDGRGLILYRETLGGAVANNFIATSPAHPIIVRAAEQARDALLERSVEIAWTKTGPGLLTCVVGQYLNENRLDENQLHLNIIDWDVYGQEIAAHNFVQNKLSTTSWENETSRHSQSYIWENLLTFINTAQ